MLDLGEGGPLPGPFAALLFQQTDFWELISHGTVLTNIVLGVLIAFSLFSITIIFSKFSAFRSVTHSDLAFLRAFRRSPGLDSAVAAAEQFRPTPLVVVFDYGFSEVSRQVKTRGGVVNKDAITRIMQVGTSEEITRLERNLSWLATTASVSPFIGLFGTVLGIIRAFQNLGAAGSTSLRAVGPGISEALIATAVGLMAAIPAAIFYNHFGRLIKDAGERMDNFALEFLNLVDRNYGE
jgi:biopolymer transport protein TolQ